MAQDGGKANTPADLYRGYSDYESHRGTLAAGNDVVTFIRGAAVGVEIDNLGDPADANATPTLFVTLEGTTPTTDGTGDTDHVMINVPSGESRTIDIASSVVKLATSGTVAWQVIALR